jgi:hypothetical protein
MFQHVSTTLNTQSTLIQHITVFRQAHDSTVFNTLSTVFNGLQHDSTFLNTLSTVFNGTSTVEDC